MLQNILQKYNIKPSKRLGQNFLIDKSVLSKIISAADLSPDDIVLEVGPGLGILTLELAKRVKKVIAVEKDKKMIEILKNVLNDKNVKNVEVVEGDILKIDTLLRHPEPRVAGRMISTGVHDEIFPPRQARGQNDNLSYKIVANIPYYLTSPLIRKFLEAKSPLEFMVLMIQKEVAQRICARPPSLRSGVSGRARPPKMTLLSVATQFYAEPKIISYVSKKSFWPSPKVDSAIIKITPRSRLSVIARRSEATTRQSHDYIIGLPSDPASSAEPLAMTTEFHNHFFKVVKAAFSQPRKQLINNLSKGLNLSREKTKEILSKAGIFPSQRPGELSVDKYRELTWIIWGK